MTAYLSLIPVDTAAGGASTETGDATGAGGTSREAVGAEEGTPLMTGAYVFKEVMLCW